MSACKNIIYGLADPRNGRIPSIGKIMSAVAQKNMCEAQRQRRERERQNGTP